MKSQLREAAKHLTLMDVPPEDRKVFQALFTTLHERLLEGVIDWGFEVLKHLVVFNGLGLAGAIAIAQLMSTDLVSRRTALAASHCFMTGLATSLVTMVGVYILGIFYLNAFTGAIPGVVTGKKPLGGILPSTKMMVAMILNWLLAVISIGFFLAGALHVMNIE